MITFSSRIHRYGISLILCSLLCLPALVNAQTHIAIVQGLGGEDYYQRQFEQQTEAINQASDLLAGAENVTLFDSSNANKESILNWFEQLQNKLSAADTVMLYLIGHGSSDARDYKFNISGPDLSGTELLTAFNNLPDANKFLLNTSSSSGVLLKTFAESNVILITATKSGNERNATRFGRFFASALKAEAADLNKNKAISAEEAFAWAKRETASFYESEGLLATEHPQLQGDGSAQLELSRWQNKPATLDAQSSALFERRNEVDRQIEQLRLRRIGMSDDDYLYEFQNLMLDLSDIQDQIDSSSGATE